MPDRVSGTPGGLRPLRLRAMMTQEELAFKSGVGIRTIRDIESGRVRPQPRTLRLLIEALALDGRDLALLTASPGRTAVVPRELPRALARFAGREAHLDAILNAAGEGAAVVAVHGMPGVGKTSLVVQAAHTLAPSYPDGQLFIDLHGFTSGAGPRPGPASMLTRLLHRLGADERDLPEEIDELTARYRSAVADRRVLLVLDNAANAGQVEALLPGTPGSLVLATSRRDLSTLTGAYSVPLEPPPMREAVAMLGAGVDRITDDEAAAIAERCGRLPLAMGLAAARLRSRPLWQAEDLLARLDHEDRLLSELDMGHYGVGAALRASYLELDPDHQRLLRRLGLLPGDDLDAHAAGALSGVAEQQAAAMLESLVDVHLVETRSPGRYRLHDLVRLFAIRLAKLEEPEDELDGALLRLLGVYRHFAYQAAARVHPNKRRFTEGAAAHDAGLPGFADQAAALSWFQSERGNLEAAVAAAAHAGRDEQAWDLAAAFNAFFVHDPDIRPHATVNGIALDIARRTGDGRKEAFTLGDAGRRLLATGRHREAIVCLERSVALKRDLGEFGDAALTLANIGILHRRCGRFAESLAAHETALAQAEAAADTAAAALIGTNMVVPLLRLGRFEEAERRLEEAERRLDAGDDHYRIRIEVFRGVLVRERGAPAEAAAVHAACLEAYRGERVKADIAATLIELAEDLLRLGRVAEATAHLDRAVRHALKLADPSLERAARNGLGRALATAGRPEAAIGEHERAVTLAEFHEDAYELARAHHGIAEAHRRRGDQSALRRHLALAARGYADCGVPEAAVAERLDLVAPG
ncbi:tetratricopeptide repeat protein [Glycomyces sp. YM15]|uniref:ATP-binding protein n=1 Tax=Glycomyces sp. YM15 TaxID=2800446 RepID=UPI0019666446|nr:tetratricopeptide repeat protein [Glycomyces sp. YM15]